MGKKLTAPSSYGTMLLYNLHTLSDYLPTMHYIGRKNKKHGFKASALANPYKMSSGLTRTEAVDKYKVYLKVHLDKATKGHITPFTKELVNLVARYKCNLPVQLVCYCAPSYCHGDILMQYICHLADYKKENPLKTYIDSVVEDMKNTLDLVSMELHSSILHKVEEATGKSFP